MSQPCVIGVHLPLVVNVRAGGRGAPLDAIRAALAAVGVTPDVVPVGTRLEDALGAAIAAGAPVAGVAGGDGSARAAARVLAGTTTALAIFPTGTLNHFSRSLGIDSLEAAARAAAGGRIKSVAAGYVDDEPFLNTATFGLYADVVRRRDRLRRPLGRWPAAFVAFNVTIARYHPLRVSLAVDGARLIRTTALVSIGVGRRSFPVKDVPPRLEQEPELVLTILRARTRSGLLGAGMRTALRLVVGLPRDQERDAETLRARELELASPTGRLGVTLDGEIVRMPQRVDVRIRHDVLRVVVPESDGR